MENFRIDITSRGDLTAAMTAAFAHAKTATHFAIRPASPAMALRLVFYRDDFYDSDLRPLPVKADGPTAAELARLWLAKAEYGDEPFHDGGVVKGWRIYNGTRDFDADWWATICAVSPVWATLSK